MAAVFRRLLSARLQAAGAALPTGMPSEGKSRNNRPRQRTSRLWMPRNGNRLKQRTSGSEAEERTPADVVLRRLQESLFFDASVLRRQQGAGSATAAEGRLGSITFDDIPEYAVDSYNDLCVARAMEKRGQFPGEFADRAYLSRADRALTPVPSEYVRPGVRRRQAKARLDTLRGMMHEGDGRYRGSQGRKGGGSYHRVSPPATI